MPTDEPRIVACELSRAGGWLADEIRSGPEYGDIPPANALFWLSEDPAATVMIQTTVGTDPLELYRHIRAVGPEESPAPSTVS